MLQYKNNYYYEYIFLQRIHMYVAANYTLLNASGITFGNKEFLKLFQILDQKMSFLQILGTTWSMLSEFVLLLVSKGESLCNFTYKNCED